LPLEASSLKTQQSHSKKQKQQFLQRNKALSLYRTIFRGTRKISDPLTREEMRGMAREEFRRNGGVVDVVSLLFTF